MRAVIADVASRYNVDRKRVFVQGLSNGAFMAHLLACQAADLIAAVNATGYGLTFGLHPRIDDRVETMSSHR